MKNSTGYKLSALLAASSFISACGSLLPPVEYEVVDTRTKPQEMRLPSVDPLEVGSVQPFSPAEFYPVEISHPEEDRTFGLTYTVDKGDWAKTQNTTQLLVEGNRVVDAGGDIVAWSDISDTGYFTYMVQRTRMNNVPDDYIHYDLKMFDVRKPGIDANVIATVAVKGRISTWTINNKQYKCDKYILTSKGLVMLGEADTLVSYFEAGKNTTTTTLPVGYKVTSFDVTADMAYSKHARIIQHRGPHKLFGVLPSAQEELYDVSWLNLETGEITTTAKDIVVNVENEKAFRNYINGAARIINSKSGPLVISIEDTLTKTVVRNLATLQKTILVETETKKGHGFVAGLERQRSGGSGEYHKVWIQFGVGNGDLSNKQINDLEAWMSKASVSYLD